MANRPCQTCGYNLDGLIVQGGFVTCPECGKRSEHSAKPSPAKKRRLGPSIWITPVVVGIIDMVILAVVVKPSSSALIIGFDGIFNLFILIVMALINGLVTTVWSVELLIQKRRLRRADNEPALSILASVLLALFFGIIAAAVTTACGMMVVNWAMTP